jgi:acetyl-CoA C-acetyltransferase
VASQNKVQAAQDLGCFAKEIVPVVLERKGKDPVVFAKDEYPRAGTTIEGLAKLRPAFKKDGTVTPGNASGINDGGATVVLMSEDRLRSTGATALAEIIGWASAGVAPETMGIGPVDAVQKLCKRTGVSLDSVECIEANEAFAVQSLAVNKLLGWKNERVNAWGGAVALGHPIGASGARILVTLTSRLSQISKKGEHFGIATLCVGGGQGIAILLRVNR